MSPTQGKNIGIQQFEALGQSLTNVEWELPAPQEFKPDELPLPALPSLASSFGMMPGALPIANGPCANAAPSPDAPVTEAQWQKVIKMAPWLGNISLHFYVLQVLVLRQYF